MKSTVTLFAFAAVYIGLISGQIPIPSRPDGYGVGGPADAHVVVEMFLDPLCPGCKASWPTMLQLIKFYGTKIHFRIHTFPLPYHTNSFLVSQGLHVIANVTNRNLNTIYNYVTEVFQNQDKWSNSATSSLTIPQVIDSLASFVDKNQLTTKDKFLQGMSSDDINFETRVSWKYAASRGVAGTPTFFINGVFVDASASWSVNDWESVINPILVSNGIDIAANKTCPAGQELCTFAPERTQCCLQGEKCIPNVGCRCFNLKNGNQCRSH